MATDNKTETPGLKAALQNAFGAVTDRAMESAQEKVSGLVDRLTEIGDDGPVRQAAAKGAEEASEGGSAVKGAVKGGLSAATDRAKDALPGGGKNEKPPATKAMNIVESIDVGVPVRVAYNQWTQYRDWTGFMKKVEEADQEPDKAEVSMAAQIFLSHRKWQSTIIDQIPDERIVWRSAGEKGHVDGCVTFHEIAPRLTRILITLEYYPQGFFERTANLWRAPGRRARLEIKHFRRHVMMNTILHPDEAEGWRGEIEDGEIIRTHDEGLDEDRRADDDSDPSDSDDEADDGDEDDSTEGDSGEDDGTEEDSGEGDDRSE